MISRRHHHYEQSVTSTRLHTYTALHCVRRYTVASQLLKITRLGYFVDEEAVHEEISCICRNVFGPLEISQLRFVGLVAKGKQRVIGFSANRVPDLESLSRAAQRTSATSDDLR